MRVLALAPFPVEAASTRYRLMQLSDALAARSVYLTVRPFIDSVTFAGLYQRGAFPRTTAGLARATGRRLSDVWRARRYDALLVHREAMIFGPPVIEWLAAHLAGRPMVLDLDDATYVAYDSPTYGRVARWLKWPGKTDSLIRMAAAVTCGNRVVAQHVAEQGVPSRVVPTVVDPDRFVPRREANQGPPVLGWIGSHSTFPYLESLAPVLQRLAREHPFRLKIVGAGRPLVSMPGVQVEHLSWSLDREVADFQSLDIGLYPMIEDSWSVGKSGFKAIQYMAVGIPYVASAVGAAGDLGEDGVTHLLAHDHDQWRHALDRLLSDADLRRRMGEAGRQHILRHYTLDHVADSLASVLEEAASA